MMRTGALRDERGTSLVEAALVIPVLLIILVLALDLGRAYFTYIAVIDAAREGARYGATDQNTTAMCARALAEAQNEPLPATLSCSANPGSGTGTPVSVTVWCNFPMITGGIVGESTIVIKHTVAFRSR
jgi:Flp pilus assembly protein TadG